MIESGQNNYQDPMVIHPLMFFSYLDPKNKGTIFHQANKSEHLAGRAPTVPVGNMLGGGSSVNMLMYSRAQKSDFDDWNTPGWSADDLQPFMRKVRADRMLIHFEIALLTSPT